MFSEKTDGLYRLIGINKILVSTEVNLKPYHFVSVCRDEGIYLNY